MLSPEIIGLFIKVSEHCTSVIQAMLNKDIRNEMYFLYPMIIDSETKVIEMQDRVHASSFFNSTYCILFLMVYNHMFSGTLTNKVKFVCNPLSDKKKKCCPRLSKQA